MDRARLFFFASCALAAAVSGGIGVACGDDDALVRTRLDGGGDGATVDGSDGDGGDGGPTCGITFPTDYVSAAYETNAKLELDLRTAFNAFIAPMKANEDVVADAGGDAAAVTQLTKTELETLWSGGAPSVKSITTPYYQTRIDGWLADYEAAAKAGSIAIDTTVPPDGGFYGTYAYDNALVDVRQAIETGSFVAAFFNHATGIVAAGGLTEASIDRLVAAWGAHATFQNNHLATAGATDATKDVASAGYAAERTPKDGKTGPYLRAKTALIQAKAAIAAGSKCDAERDAALKIFFAEWEKATYASVVFFLNDTVAKMSPAPPAQDDVTAWTNIFHSHGVAIGLIAGFKSTPANFRKITDAQIDDLLAKALLPEGSASKIIELKTAPTTSVISLNGALSDIKALYGFSDDEMASFKQIFTK